MTRPQTRNQIVSSDDERLILVDSNDRELGTSPKSDCHDGDGILHRAFSLFVFNADGSLLIHQRHADKRLWPLYLVEQLLQPPARGRGHGSGRRPPPRTGTRSARELALHVQVRIRGRIRRYRQRTRTVLGLCRDDDGRTGRQYHRGRRVALDHAGRARCRTRARHPNASRRGSSSSGRRCAALTASASNRRSAPSSNRPHPIEMRRIGRRRWQCRHRCPSATCPAGTAQNRLRRSRTPVRRPVTAGPGRRRPSRSPTRAHRSAGTGSAGSPISAPSAAIDRCETSGADAVTGLGVPNTVPGAASVR